MKDWPRDEWPNVAIVFFSFRVMVGLGVAMVGVGLVSLYLRYRRRLFAHPWFLRTALYMGPSGLIALLAGWFVTEVGRQPYTVYGLLRTSDSLSPIDLPAVSCFSDSVCRELRLCVWCWRFLPPPAHAARTRCGRGRRGRILQRKGPGALTGGRVVDLALTWAVIIAFAVLAYALLDGFDLGVGILFPWFDDAGKDSAIQTLAPIWDGNETWLVLGGGGLFAVFPLAYSVLLTAFYPLVIAMLIALVFRGASLEYPSQDDAVARRLGHRLLAWLGGGCVEPGHHARRVHPGRDSGWSRLRGRLVRLADAVFNRLWPGDTCGLCTLG